MNKINSFHIKVAQTLCYLKRHSFFFEKNILVNIFSPRKVISGHRSILSRLNIQLFSKGTQKIYQYQPYIVHKPNINTCKEIKLSEYNL